MAAPYSFPFKWKSPLKGTFPFKMYFYKCKVLPQKNEFERHFFISTSISAAKISINKSLIMNDYHTLLGFYCY